MKSVALSPAPAAGAPLPAVPEVPVLHGLSRLLDLARGIAFWGILGFGVSFPFCAALYAYLRP